MERRKASEHDFSVAEESALSEYGYVTRVPGAWLVTLRETTASGPSYREGRTYGTRREAIAALRARRDGVPS